MVEDYLCLVNENLRDSAIFFLRYEQQNINTRCQFTQKPCVANCVIVRTCACSVADALVTWMMCDARVDSLKFDKRKQRCLPKEASQ